MKTCAICMTENAADAVTCVACGEGSFAPEAPVAIPASPALPPESESTTKVEPEPTDNSPATDVAPSDAPSEPEAPAAEEPASTEASTPADPPRVAGKRRGR